MNSGNQLASRTLNSVGTAIVIGVVVLATSPVAGQQSDFPTEPQIESNATVQSDWLTGRDETLAFNINGTVVDASGQATAEVAISARTLFRSGSIELNIKQNGSQFHVQVPAQGGWINTYVFATTKDGTHQCSYRLSSHQIRHLAQRGIELQLQPAMRILTVSTRHDEKPIGRANVLVCCGESYRVAGQTDDQGVVHIPMLQGERITELIAWKGFEYVGGYTLHDPPQRDPDADLHNIEMYLTRERVIRLQDEAGQPVSDTPFEINVGTPSPDRNGFGTDEVFALKSDSAGEAVVPWFPNMENPSIRIRTRDERWELVKAGEGEVGGRFEITVRQIEPKPRVRITGRVDSQLTDELGGYNIQFRSFQGEFERQMDSIVAFSNPDGTFSVDVLPGSTYCVALNDEYLVSSPQFQMLFDPNTETASVPIVEMIRGRNLRIVATCGPDRKPYGGLPVMLDGENEFSWMQDGRERTGSLGRKWLVYTNENGIAETIAPEGSLELWVTKAGWRHVDRIRVNANDDTTIVKIHRPIAEPVRIQGQLVSDEPTVDFSQVQIVVAAFDGHTSGNKEVSSDMQGRFAFKTQASEVAVFARSEDGAAAAFQVIDVPSETVRLKMTPTVSYQGRVVGPDNRPVPECRVRAKVKALRDPRFALPQYCFLDGGELDATTDERGFFTIEQVPVGIRFELIVSPSTEAEAAWLRIGQRFISPDEQDRPIDVVQLAPKRFRQTHDLITRYETTLKDCKHYDVRMLVIVASDNEGMKLSRDVIYDDEVKSVQGYFPFWLDTTVVDERNQQQQLFDFRGWELPEPGNLLVAALDSRGKEVGRVVVAAKHELGRERLIAFMHEHEPTARDAHEAFAAAIAEAKESDRVVWAQYSQTTCLPCRKLSRWIDKHREVLEKDFVFLLVDDVRQSGGTEVSQKITRGRDFGIPFVAILDAEGEVIIDSEGPLGNIGFPSTYEGATHLREMISRSGKRITEDELDVLVDSLLSTME